MAPWPPARSCTPSPARPRTTSSRSSAGRGRAASTTPTGRPTSTRMASLWYSNIGHGRGEMADAVAAQIRTLEAYSCFDPFTNPPAEELADLLATWSPLPDTRVFFTSSGSEAVDSAIKLARIAQVQAGHPERTLVVSRTFGYHGVTYGGLSAQGLPPNQAGFGPLLPDFVNLPERRPRGHGHLFAEQGDEIAAVITEPVQGAGGVRPPVDGYLAGLRRLCDQHGAYLDHGRGDLRLRPPRPLVRQRLLRRPARPHHLRQGRHLGLRAPRRGARRLGGPRGRSKPTRRSGSATATRTRATPRPARPAWRPMAITVREGLLERRQPRRRPPGSTGCAPGPPTASWPRCGAKGAVWAVAVHPGRTRSTVRDRMLARRRHHPRRRHRHADVLPAAGDRRRPDRPHRRRPRRRRRRAAWLNGAHAPTRPALALVPAGRLGASRSTTCTTTDHRWRASSAAAATPEPADGRRPAPRTAAAARRTGVGLAVVGAIALGLRDVFDRRRRASRSRPSIPGSRAARPRPTACASGWHRRSAEVGRTVEIPVVSGPRAADERRPRRRCRSSRSAAFFDLDRTLISGSSAFAFAVAAWRNDLVHVPPARPKDGRRRARLPPPGRQRRQGRRGPRAHPGRRRRRTARPTSSPSTPDSSRSCWTRCGPRRSGCSRCTAGPAATRSSCRPRRRRSSARWPRPSA